MQGRMTVFISADATVRIRLQTSIAFLQVKMLVVSPGCYM